MVRKRLASHSHLDFGSWNFIVFLTLAFILIVFVAVFMSDRARDLSAKAGISCPQITGLPSQNACPGGRWVLGKDSNNCTAFFCERK